MSEVEGDPESVAEDDVPRLTVSRQPVVDGRLKVAGYWLSRPPEGSAEPNALALNEALSLVAKSERATGVNIHVPVTRAEIAAGALPRMERDRTVVWLTYADAVSDEAQAALAAGAARGLTLGLTALPGRDFDRSLLERFKVVDIDMAAWTLNAAAILRGELAERDIPVLASGMATHVQRRVAHSVGFDRFAGPFYTTPELMPGKRIPVGDIATIVELAQAHGPGTSIDQLVAVIDRDVVLSVKLLQYINSAYFGLATRVTSIRHAVALLGPRGISRWAMIVMLLDRSPPIRHELGLIALVRARMCELLGETGGGHEGAAGSRFTVGLLSAADAVLGSPMPEILAEMPLSPDVHAALESHTGELGAILAEVLAFERGDFASEAIHTPLRALGQTYRDVLIWARASQSGLA